MRGLGEGKESPNRNQGGALGALRGWVVISLSLSPAVRGKPGPPWGSYIHCHITVPLASQNHCLVPGTLCKYVLSESINK